MTVPAEMNPIKDQINHDERETRRLAMAKWFYLAQKV